MKMPPRLVSHHSERSGRINSVYAVAHEMAQGELMNMIPPAILAQIKARDPNPKFRAYIVGHEGESHGRISIDNSSWVKIAKKWISTAIRNLHDKIMMGTQLFHGHTEEANRESIGEVVGKKLANIRDRLSVVIAAYIRPEFVNLPLDVASIEADITLSESTDGDYYADVDGISGIALGNREVETPGFEGATLLTKLFEFAEKSDKGD